MVAGLTHAWSRLQAGWQAFRRRYWLALGFDVAVLIAIFVGVTAWQSNHLLAADGSQQAPDFTLRSLDGHSHRLSEAHGRTTLVYFFAPWCNVCALSASNIEALRAARTEEELAIYMVALGYDSEQEVRRFADEHGLSVPILLGGQNQIHDYRIRGFPTYYVVNAEGRLRHRSIGYSTEWGLRWRTW